MNRLREQRECKNEKRQKAPLRGFMTENYPIKKGNFPGGRIDLLEGWPAR